MLDLRDKELADCQKTLEDARKKAEADQLSSDKEMNDLRTQLGQVARSSRAPIYDRERVGA